MFGHILDTTFTFASMLKFIVQCKYTGRGGCIGRGRLMDKHCGDMASPDYTSPEVQFGGKTVSYKANMIAKSEWSAYVSRKLLACGRAFNVLFVVLVSVLCIHLICSS